MSAWHKKARKWLPRGVWVLLMALMLSQPGQAQQAAEGRLVLSNFDASNFPEIRFRIEVFDSQGQFVPDLTFADLQVIEDGNQLPLNDLQRVQPGLQIVTAFTPSPLFSVKRDGVTLLEALKAHFAAWAASQPLDSPDEFSIATSTGMLALRLTNPAMWVEALTTYQPQLPQSQPTLVSLSQALDLAADPGTQTGQHQVIFLVTALPPANARTSLEGLVDLAISLGVRVNVLLVHNSSQVPLQSAEHLIRLADGTGGEFFVYTGAEALPDIEAALKPLRYHYQARYTSRINQTGWHSARVQLLLHDLPLTSAATSFQIKVDPPNPIFLSPPVTIHREWTQPEDRRAPRFLVPESHPIQILVEFPDGHPRQLQRSALYVNGDLLTENTKEPFDVFTLLLNDYTQTTRLMLQAEVVDSLALSGRTLDIPIEIAVPPEPRRLWGDIITAERGLAAAALALTAAILTAVLVLSGRRKKRLSSRVRRDPVTQPVPIRQVKPAKPRAQPGTAALTVDPAIPLPETVPASLLPLNETGSPLTEPALPLYHGLVSFGRDAARSNRVLADPSVHARHCQITVTPEGSMSVIDCGSATGTWVNYRPIGPGAHPLEHGDLLHIGRLPFRVERSSPPQDRQPVVLPYEEHEP